jgi:hypothetical protein
MTKQFLQTLLRKLDIRHFDDLIRHQAQEWLIKRYLLYLS